MPRRDAISAATSSRNKLLPRWQNPAALDALISRTAARCESSITNKRGTLSSQRRWVETAMQLTLLVRWAACAALGDAGVPLGAAPLRGADVVLQLTQEERSAGWRGDVISTLSMKLGDGTTMTLSREINASAGGITCRLLHGQ
jgi:hypothetical protein